MRTAPFVLLLALTCACSGEPPRPANAGPAAGEAERRAAFEEAKARSEKNAKVTRRPRRFSGESL